MIEIIDGLSEGEQIITQTISSQQSNSSNQSSQNSQRDSSMRGMMMITSPGGGPRD
jgi:hypothetical protein